ncbi:THUMP domain-containing class I SAM-dependent RNA methyltransferase [Fusibacter tunisiensis]|uniref:N6-adenine-specific DNA methylase n=1 Tax=Fusibacter tunisiensis TaxID=1008308 RepID=A0ABS2MNK5_9FIRM|nr:class I SAM-dependent RNA methyltransferase [Fusibacter tunisiensis]MBM7560973.1 putative N6-adenine-specific DNA methylase [Fusibacter tunisiensis]
MKLRLIATAVFGLEAIVAQEIKDLGFENVITENGRVLFDSDAAGLVKANLWIRTAERIFLCVGQFKAKTFEQLFQGVTALPWEAYIPKDAAFPVDANSVKSTLFSLSDIQSISKKAIVKRLVKLHKTEWFEETGETYRIRVSILKDEVTVAIDTSGTGLHRRGYREKANEAPLKETLAAGLIAVSKWTPDRPFIDPFCGSGTLVIEAAMKAKNIAPGLNRQFDCEKWRWIPSELWKASRKEAYEAIEQTLDIQLEGYDIDPKAVEIARENAELAGVDDIIHFQVRDIRDFSTKKQYGTILCNPPYGERLNDIKEVEKLVFTMGQVFDKYPTWSKYILTAFEAFETFYGQKATKNRKLYNGRIKTHFYMYFGARPPRKNVTSEEAR